VNLQGVKEVFGLWVAQTEGAQFWLSVITELKNPSVADIFIACVGGLKGLPEAIGIVFPRTEVQVCIMHTIRTQLPFRRIRPRLTLSRSPQGLHPTVHLSHWTKANIINLQARLVGVIKSANEVSRVRR
jgi:hypothetical protein